MASLELLEVAKFVGSGGIGALVATMINYRLAKKSVRVDEFEAITAALNKRIDDLKEENKRFKDGWSGEELAHGLTKARLRAAMRHIRAFTNWLNTDRTATPPEIPSELLDEI